MVGCAVVSFVALVAIGQKPSRFFGASPLLPRGWVIAAGATTAELDEVLARLPVLMTVSFPFSGAGVLVDVLRFFPIFPGVPHG